MLWSYFTFVASGRGMYGETMVTISFSVLAGIMLTYRFSLYQFWFHTFFLLLFLLLFFLLQFVHCFACGYWLFPIYKLKKDFLVFLKIIGLLFSIHLTEIARLDIECLKCTADIHSRNILNLSERPHRPHENHSSNL